MGDIVSLQELQPTPSGPNSITSSDRHNHLAVPVPDTEISADVSTVYDAHSTPQPIDEDGAQRSTSVRTPSGRSHSRSENTTQHSVNSSHRTSSIRATSTLQSGMYGREPILASTISRLRYRREARREEFTIREPIPPLTISVNWDTPPAGWISCIHPEGDTYLVYREEDMHLFTRGDITDARYLCDLVDRGRELYQCLRENSEPTAVTRELFLEFDDTIGYKYYFTDHQTRCIFWLDELQGEELELLYGDAPGIQRLVDLKYALEKEYWTHCEMFPNDRIVSLAVLEELRGTILHAVIDTLTSDCSTAPFDNQTLSKMLKLIDVLQLKAGTNDTHTAVVSARFMGLFAQSKFVNFHGQADARLASDQTVIQTDTQRRSFVWYLLSWALFNAPAVHAREFKKVWVDHTINGVTWRPFITTLTSEWQEMTIFSTVLLNANVAFLAIPGVILDNTSPGTVQTAAQIASYISILMSLGSVILSLLLVRQNRTKEREKIDEGATFLSHIVRLGLGMDSLTYIFSLPYALLMWSVVYFVLAVAFLVFQHTSIVTRVLVGTTFGLVTLLTGWSMLH
ncbi:hypothetical protein OBBRIDRAFT_791238 [Obba rivulosa]|uniref:Uncharacterized protein n=1 Tax=Obba rivulosa TaxID=1052685 RepID=A0A8E2B1X2_9APHY|nr:hypothetical protein OBBRIDRAFT_791238 [Obba rivulosa]